ncbi:hypothetical protein SLEP1_g10172 [Rubroshorea leprosula]|uniref:NB-ARC domain-containing protein n=1 Tax=Rubroshorea leprosula TaxID=152421 RepID=A0AAV5IGP6_9ROSI|nr:hypothetical protein SLEP1_g10172 [Rubroshorea leprosula]
MPINKLPRQEESKSFIDESSLLGRDDVKNEIISHLLYETSKEREDSPIQTISVVGIGGIGKTALAQLVYNDENVKQHFTCRVWTCVSDIFDESKVAKSIIVGLQGLDKLAILQLESVPLDALLDKICKSIEGKKYLLVLDDIWTEKDKDFEGLNATFKCGDPGSRILVTTRKSTVATIMGSSHTIQLNNLSREICWSIIRNIALRGKDQRTCEEFKPIGLKIAEKCKGLPLVAKTLGGLLRFKTGIQGWENVLNSELWRMEMVQKDVYVPLLLSYYDLPSSVRQCFTYLAVAPKDKRFYVFDLISHWMAQGFLDFDDDDDSPLELKGFEYFQCLKAHCFFQDFEYKHEHLICKIHDLVHDFALFLTGGEFMTLEISKGNTCSTMNKERTPRHLTVMVEEGLYCPEFIPNAEKLRSVVARGNNIREDCAPISEKAMCNLFNQARRLRAVFMVRNVASTLPEEIGNLLHLRYLNLALNSNLKKLPKALFRLHNLEHLNLYSCFNLERLPDEIRNLVNLRFLCTTGGRFYLRSHFSRGTGISIPHQLTSNSFGNSSKADGLGCSAAATVAAGSDGAADGSCSSIRADGFGCSAEAAATDGFGYSTAAAAADGSGGGNNRWVWWWQQHMVRQQQQMALVATVGSSGNSSNSRETKGEMDVRDM